MKRQTRTTKQIIKAVSVGLSASMLLQPVTAMADGLDETAPVLPDVEEKEEVPYVNAADEDAASENKEALENAAELIDDAIDKEDATEHAAEELQRATVDPLEKGTISAIENTEDNDNHVIVPIFPFIGIDLGDQKDSAEEYETSAGKKVDEAQNILDEAEKELTGDPEAKEEADKTGVLDEFEENIQASEGYSYESVKEAAQAAADMLTADAASVSANEATSSAEASEYAEVAKQASEEAEKMSVSANENAANALDEYNEASKLLEQAKAIAKEANAEAEKKIKAGYEDAKEAVKKAKEAEEYAEGLEKYVGLKKAAADAYVTELNEDIKNLTEEINKLNFQIGGKYGELFWADLDYTAKYNTLCYKLGELRRAQGAMYWAPTAKDVESLKQQLKDLEDAKRLAKENLNTLKLAAEGAGRDNRAAQKALEGATAAYNQIKDAYNQASATVEEVTGQKTVLEGDVEDLKSQYGDDIMDKQSALRNASDEGKSDAAKALIKSVMGADEVTAIAYEEIPNGIFMVKTGETVSYYTYEIASNGTITIKNCTYDVVEATTQAVEAEIASNLSESQKDALIAGLEDGSFFVKPNDKETFMLTYKAQKEKNDVAYYKDDKGVQHVVKCLKGNGNDLHWYIYDNGSKGAKVPSGQVYKIAKSGLTSEAADKEIRDNKIRINLMKVSEGVTTVYTVTSNVDSKLITEAELANGTWLASEKVSDAVEGTDAVYAIVVEGDVKPNGSHNRFWNTEPEYANDDYKYDYRTTYGNTEYTVDNGTLRWDKNQGWQIKGYNGNNRWKNIGSISENNRHTIVAYLHNNIEGLSEAEADAYGYGDSAKVLVKEATDAKPATYRVYYNKTTETPGSVNASVDSDALSLTDIVAKLNELQGQINEAQGVVDTNQGTADAYNAAVTDADAKKKAFVEADRKYKDELSKYSGQHYTSRIAALKKAAYDAEAAYNAAKNRLDEAQREYNQAFANAGFAYYKAEGIRTQISALEKTRDGKISDKSNLKADLKEAEKVAKYYGERLKKANDLEDKAEAARIAAEKARDALKLLRGTSNVGAEAIRKAEEELSTALNQYLDAKKLADLSKEDAEKAKESYKKILDRVEELLREEAERRTTGEGDEDEGGETTPTTPAPAGNILVAQAGPAVVIPATATATAGAPEDEEPEDVAAEETTQQTITDNSVPMAAAPTEQTINEQDVPLAPMDEQAKMSWWWIIVVLVLGTTGAELLRRRMVKKNTATLESTKSDK